MRRLLLLSAVLCAAAFAQPIAAAEWSTGYGTMVLPDNPEPGALRAEYGTDEGRIIGMLMQPKCLDCGLWFDGIWVEAGSGQTCATEEDGSAHWGGVSLQFDPGYTSFAGEWDYCGEGKTYSWRGQAGQRGTPTEGER